MNEDNLTSINRFPNEMLVKVFLFLDPKSIIACRAVCCRWQQILDDPITSDKLWYKHCKINYNDIYKTAYVKSMPGLSWCQLYKSITLWSQLSLAQETVHEISLKNSNDDYYSDFQILRNGVIGVLTKSSIVYYNVDTLQVTQEFSLADNNDYYSYNENDDTILLINRSDQLFVRRKDNREIITNIFEDVFNFLLLDNVIYFVTSSNTIYKCTFIEGSYTSTCLLQVPEKVLALGHQKGRPCIFTNINTIYSYVNNALKQEPVIDYVFQWETISKYNFSDNSGWRNMCTFCIFSNLCNQDTDYQEIYNIYHVRIHGPVMIVGYGRGILRIFYSAYIKTVTDLHDSAASKEYYLLKPHEDILDDIILNIDVVEGDLTHTVVVAMRAKIVIIKISHPHDNEEMSHSLKDTSSNSKVKSMTTRKPSLSYAEPGTESPQTLTPDDVLTLQSEKESSSSGEPSPKLTRRFT